MGLVLKLWSGSLWVFVGLYTNYFGTFYNRLYNIYLPASLFLPKIMRGFLQTVCLLPMAIGSVLPTHNARDTEGTSFDIADDILAGLGSIKQDLMASGAAINQQLYQAAQQPDQYSKCNPANVQVRKEW